MATITQDRGTIGNLHDLIHAMRHIDNGNTLCLELGQEGKELFNIMGRKCRARFIKNKNARLLGDGLDDFSQLALAGTQASRLCQWININIKSF